MKPVKLDQIEHRIPDIGRIRSGKKTSGKRQDGSTYRGTTDSKNWILSAQTTDNLEILRADYGGELEAWDADDTPDKFRLFTETEILHVVLPPSALSVPKYERWEGGQCRRRCNGETCLAFPKDPEAARVAFIERYPDREPPEMGATEVEIPCVCVGIDDDRKTCKPKQHLGVILPQTPIGVWRLVTTSMNAITELAASVEIVRMAAMAKLPRAVLTRVDRISGEKHYRVPIVTTEATFDQLEAAAHAAGALGAGQPGTLVGLGSAPQMALPTGAVTAPIDPAFGGVVDEVAPADMEAARSAAAPDVAGGLSPTLTAAEVEEIDAEGREQADALMAKMKATMPATPKKAAKAPRKAAKKRAAKKAPEVPEADEDAQEAAMGEEGRGLIRAAWLNLETMDQEAAEALLAAAGLWPIDTIPDSRVDEAGSIITPVVDAAAKAGRV